MKGSKKPGRPKGYVIRLVDEQEGLLSLTAQHATCET